MYNDKIQFSTRGIDEDHLMYYQTEIVKNMYDLDITTDIDYDDNNQVVTMTFSRELTEEENRDIFNIIFKINDNE